MPTFSLSRAMTLLGIRSTSTLPEINTGQLQATIQMGSVSTFAPQLIEARGLVGSNGDFSWSTNGTWLALFMQSLAPGGSVIESVFLGDPGNTGFRPELHVAEAFPSSALAFPVRAHMSVGGAASVNVWFLPAGEQGGVMPIGDTFLPTTAPTVYIGPPDKQARHDSTMFSGIFVPPGGGFWIGINHVSAGNASTLRVLVRWREFPEGLGAP